MTGYITIGKVARRSGVNPQTVFYYERRGLLEPSKRSESGYRLYTEEAVRIIRFIKNAQELGFSLGEVAELLRLRVGRRAQCASVRRRAEARLKIVQEKIAGLHAIEKTLGRLIRTCARKATTDPCPILESFEDRRRIQ